MANFDEFKQQTADTAEMIAGKSIQLAKKAAEKTKQLAKIAKLKAEILAEKEAARKLYNKLGKLYYELHEADPEEPMAETVGHIGEALKRIQEMNDRVEEIKAESKLEEDVEVEIEIEIDCTEQSAGQSSEGEDAPVEEPPAVDEEPEIVE